MHYQHLPLLQEGGHLFHVLPTPAVPTNGFEPMLDRALSDSMADGGCKAKLHTTHSIHVLFSTTCPGHLHLGGQGWRREVGA